MGIKKYITNTWAEDYARSFISLIPYRWRKLDGEFYKFYNLLKINEKKSYDDIISYQNEKLSCILYQAYNKTNFYNYKFKKNKFHPKDFKERSDLIKIPVLTKEEVRTHAHKMMRNDAKKFFTCYTSGTTGKPLALYMDKKTNSREWAAICYQWERVGYRPGEGRIEFRGFVNSNQLFQELRDQKVLRVNILKLNDYCIDAICKKIISKGYRFIHGYPSAIFKFAQLVKSKKITLNFQGVMLASEVVHNFQLVTIREVFERAKIIAHYGQTEKVALGAWNEDSRYYFIPSYSLVELDKENNEILGTGFINDAMPLIRYKLTDKVNNFIENPNSENTLFPVVSEIEGRQEDITFSFDRNSIPPAVVTFPFKHLNNIRACKLVQYSFEKIQIIAEGDQTEKTKNEILKLIAELKAIYGEKMNFEYNIVDFIPTDKSGKFRWVECKIQK